MNRRNFLLNSAALIAAPGLVKAENIMKIWVLPERKVLYWNMKIDVVDEPFCLVPPEYVTAMHRQLEYAMAKDIALASRLGSASSKRRTCGASPYEGTKHVTVTFLLSNPKM